MSMRLRRNKTQSSTAAMMAAPTQARRDLKTPLSRTQHSSSTKFVLMALGALAILATGGFLFTMSLRAASDPSPPNIAVRSEKKNEVLLNANKKKPNEEESKAELKVEEKNDVADEDTLIISTKHGDVKIVMRPDLSAESVAYVHALVDSGKCKRCNLYRAEKPGILQGIMQDPTVSYEEITKGKCPPEYQDEKQDCPAHDPQCACHGPIMTKGMVGWAAGGTGPDFFIDSYEKPAKFWQNQHTVFGEIKDDASFSVIEKIYTLPATNKGLTFLDEKIEFTLSFG